MGQCSAVAEIAAAATGTLVVCELARWAALVLAEVTPHATYTFSYSVGARAALWGVGVPVVVAGLEWRYHLVTRWRSTRLGLGLIGGGVAANTYELAVFGGIADYLPMAGGLASVGDLALAAGALTLTPAVGVLLRQALGPSR